MESGGIVAISAAVVALTQLFKWGGFPLKWSPILVLVLSAIGVVAWAFSNLSTWDRTTIWPLFTAWIAVATCAAGVFGFTRAAADQLVATRTKAEPPALELPPGAAPHG